MQAHRLGKQVGVHVLWHSFAIPSDETGLENGVDTLTVKALLGHSNVSTTARYVHVQNSRMKGLPDLLARW
ncbi:MAG: tyrosine-type recombinase/integrase [Lewinellaceae bacterium]|nr:tyrosine-type recombinase/integrase [Lewinellaceae bacterium]